jgi:tRNA (mo5U34)-methyltransferase
MDHHLALQDRINAISWYHEFDFGNGLRAKATTPDAKSHRQLWRFIETELDKIEFSGKTVLDIGCWDGYWSFYAERRGAKSVLATDDRSQNWAGDSGFSLAKELLRSNVESNTDLSVYKLSTLNRTFDVILCLGVYYHLVDPYYAFAQVRNCCHPGTIVIFEGDALYGHDGPSPQAFVMLSSDTTKASRFVPTPEALRGLLKGAYFSVTKEAVLNQGGKRGVNRILISASPSECYNDFYIYRPPFGLDVYDLRYSIPDNDWWASLNTSKS